MWRLRKVQQQILFAQENALKLHFPKEFFARIPRTPGVYTFYGAQDQILYIGKAKNLKNRIMSYRRATPELVSRKVLRMLRLTRDIRWEELPSERDALLRENELLRTIQPPFNVVNTRPESYYVVCMRRLGEYRVEFKLRTAGADINTPEIATAEPGSEASETFGVFKGRGRVREAFQALLRLLWFVSSPEPQKEMTIPYRLMRTNPIYEYTLQGHEANGSINSWCRLVGSYFKGTNRKLLRELTSSLLQRPDIPPFLYSLIQNDLTTLDEFFALSTRRNYRLRRYHGIKDGIIPHDEIDDLIVMFNFKE